MHFLSLVNFRIALLVLEISVSHKGEIKGFQGVDISQHKDSVEKYIEV